MSEFGGTATLILAKGGGAIAGSAISLAYMLPRGRREAATRFAVGFVSGMVFGGAAGLKLADQFGLSGRLSEAETALAGAAAVSLLSWWLVGAAIRAVEARAGRNPDKDGGDA